MTNCKLPASRTPYYIQSTHTFIQRYCDTCKEVTREVDGKCVECISARLKSTVTLNMTRINPELQKELDNTVYEGKMIEGSIPAQ